MYRLVNAFDELIGGVSISGEGGGGYYINLDEASTAKEKLYLSDQGALQSTLVSVCRLSCVCCLSVTLGFY